MTVKKDLNNTGKLYHELLKLIIESSPTALLLSNSEGGIMMVNKHFEDIFGYDKKEVIGRKVEMLIPEQSVSRHIDFRSKYMSAPSSRIMGKGRDLLAVKKDGEIIPVEIGLSPLNLDSEVYLLSTIVDISDRKKTELDVKRAKERLSAIMDNSTDAIIEFDIEGNILTVNHEAMTQYFPDSDENMNIWQIIPNETIDNYRLLLEEVQNGRKVHDLETKRIMHDGTSKTVSIGLTYIEDDINRFIETVRDINDRIILRNKIVEIEKSQIIGKMAEGIAHHMGTPLASILLRVQMLKEDFSCNEDMEQYLSKLEQMEKQIGYGQEFLNRMLKFVGRPSYDKSQYKLYNLVKESTEIVKPLLNRNKVELETIIPDNYLIECDRNLLQMVISDLIMNSIDAIENSGKISITADKDYNDDTITIRIKDNGSGISKKVLPFVFEPFYTTKSYSKGTGLGLAVAKNIIQEHDGEISIESKSGKGTVVIIKLPVHKEMSYIE